MDIQAGRLGDRYYHSLRHSGTGLLGYSMEGEDCSGRCYPLSRNGVEHYHIGRSVAAAFVPILVMDGGMKGGED